MKNKYIQKLDLWVDAYLTDLLVIGGMIVVTIAVLYGSVLLSTWLLEQPSIFLQAIGGVILFLCSAFIVYVLQNRK